MLELNKGRAFHCVFQTFPHSVYSRWALLFCFKMTLFF